MSKKRKIAKRKENKKKNTTSLFSIMKEAIKEAYKKYKIQMEQAVEKKKLLNSHSDWSMIEEFVKQVNDNPKLRIHVVLKDGTSLTLNTYREKEDNTYEVLEY